MPDLSVRSHKIGTGIKLFHIFVISLSLAVTIGAWRFSKYQTDKRVAARFEAMRDQTVGLLRDRMQKYEDALWAGVATVESHGGDISMEAWRTFAESLRIDEVYPGINGIGLIHYVEPATLDTYLAARRNERPGFRIFPAHDNPEYMPISFIEPVDINAAAVGLDIAHETNRRAAALASRDTGLAQITGPIVLVQDSGSTPGFLFYAPFYEGARPSTTAKRQEHFVGAVYAPFVVRKLMEGLLAKELRNVRFSIRDGGEIIYDEHDAQDPLHDPDPMLSEQVSLDLYGRSWTIDLRSNLAFREGNTYAKPTMILVAGLIIEALIIALLFMLSSANHRAVAYANAVTEALRKKSKLLAEANDALVNTNEELEQFVYITSHDLKTPIRGIGWLAEIIEEDLEDYFASPQMKPEVRENLGHIQDRVGRMNELTRGILEFSRIDADDTTVEPVEISEIIEALKSDFKLTDAQLELKGDVTSIHEDTFNFRRVLENLVGNAVKYHDGGLPVRIVVTVEDLHGRCKVSVKDNGPGIDPRFHGRVFDVFQALGGADGPESTGIGLAIVKKSVKRNGGEIHVESTEGNGATFTFDWPNAVNAQYSRPFREAS